MPDRTEQVSFLKKIGITKNFELFQKRFFNKTIVVKYGGHAMGDQNLAIDFAHNIVFLKEMGINPIVVHGGGPQIAEMLERLSIKSTFVDGLRVTSAETIDVVEMVLAGSINKKIVCNINGAGGFSIGLSGKDGNLITATKVRRSHKDPESKIERVLDLGFVGEPKNVNTILLKRLQKENIIPVIAPIAQGIDGETYNINADTVAGAIASSVKAERLLMLTDVKGVLDNKQELISEIESEKAHDLIKNGTINGGMIPKVETCLIALEKGIKGAVILDGRKANAILFELFTLDGSGTLIK
ncbi:MAG: acetylglutamate kinase [Rhodospirillaceae bacterium]|nr:acetylglutamate kinase [Rhodospirillaceae bacterium]|tara:strand:- start:417 stop:1313 length:897 start_codon:yes stop_codon:yes gene_type:complete